MSDACAEILQDFCSQFYNCYINRGLFSKLALRNISSCIKAQDLFVAASKLTAASCMYLLCIFRSRIMFVFGVCRNEHIALMLYAVYMFVIGQKIEQVSIGFLTCLFRLLSRPDVLVRFTIMQVYNYNYLTFESVK